MPTILPFRAARLARLLPALVAGLLALPLSGAEPAEGWIAFEATWSAAGHRRVLRAGDREAATTHLSGTMTVLRGEGLRRGFRGEAIGYSDGAAFGVGTLVLTDDHGDRVFCDLREQTSPGGTVYAGTIRGGSGAYSGVTGSFSFRWRHLVTTPEGEVQGMTVGLAGRYRKLAAPPAPAGEVPR